MTDDAGGAAWDDGPGLDVLLVEDDEDTADSTAWLLRWAGHRVRVARTGSAALSAAGRRSPDVAVLDLGLPRTDGFAVAAVLRRPVAGRRPLLVAVSGYGGDADRRRSDRAGVDLHLVKPVPPAVLLGVLARFRRVLAADSGWPPPAGTPFPTAWDPARVGVGVRASDGGPG